jgi:hypothetical protein
MPSYEFLLCTLSLHCVYKVTATSVKGSCLGKRLLTEEIIFVERVRVLPQSKPEQTKRKGSRVFDTYGLGVRVGVGANMATLFSEPLQCPQHSLLRHNVSVLWRSGVKVSELHSHGRDSLAKHD